MKKPIDRKTTIDPAHSKIEGRMPDREQLRRRLLKMILQNEAQRRSTETKNRAKPGLGNSSTINSLSVFDPEDLIGKELAAENNEQQTA
jgi:hypothetical protein